jgi:hypothetical protein
MGSLLNAYLTDVTNSQAQPRITDSGSTPTPTTGWSFPPPIDDYAAGMYEARQMTEEEGDALQNTCQANTEGAILSIGSTATRPFSIEDARKLKKARPLAPEEDREAEDFSKVQSVVYSLCHP